MASSRLYRTRSLSTVAISGRAASVDPLAGISRIRDDDFRRTINEKVSNAKRSLSVRPDGEVSSRASRSRHYSTSDPPAASSSTVAYLPINTGRSSGVILPSAGNVEFWPTTVNDPGRTAVRHTSVQPEVYRRRVETETLSLPAAITTTRMRVLEDADAAVKRGDRMSALLQQLKRVDGTHNHHQQADDEYPSSSRSARWTEIDTFAEALGTLALPSLRSSSTVDVRRRPVEGGDDFVVRLATSRGDLHRLEGLASKTFNWRNQPEKWEKQFASAVTTTHEPSTAYTGAKSVEVKLNQSPREIFTFFNDKSVGITQKDTVADQAIRWAQQRRLALEGDLQKERMRHTYGLHDAPTAVSVLGLVRRPYSLSSRPRYQRDPEEEEYVADDIYTPFSVPTVVRPSSTSRGRDRGYSTANANTDDLDVFTRQPRAYTRSSSNVEVGRYGENDFSRQPRRYDAPEFSAPQKPQQKTSKFAAKPEPVQPVKVEMSDTRRRVREVLAKSKGDPNYFDRRPTDDDDY